LVKNKKGKMSKSRSYYFVVGAVFKNEADSIREWAEHYLYRGADKIYLIDDQSTDDSIEKLQEYIEDGKIEILRCKEGKEWGRYEGRQRGMYNHFLLPLIPKTQWFLIVDID
jgi:hypothetical protein